MDILAAAVVAAIVLVAALLLLGRPAKSAGAGKPGRGLLARGLKSRREGRSAEEAGRRGGQVPAGPGRERRCPLCGSALEGGERVKSDLTPGKGDRIMRIFGCPHCWPVLEGKAPRLCPVCSGEIPADGHAVARYFESPGRKHVHVLGCSRCRPRS